MTESFLFWTIIALALMGAGAMMALMTDLHFEINELRERRKERDNLHQEKRSTEVSEDPQESGSYQRRGVRTFRMYKIGGSDSGLAE